MKFDVAMATADAAIRPSVTPTALQPVVDDFVAKVARDVAAELEVTWDHALTVGWPEDQLKVVRGDGSRTWLSATDGHNEVFRLVEVWLEQEADGLALAVKRVAEMPAPVPRQVFYPVRYGQADVYTAAEIESKCRALVERGTKPTLPEVRPLIDAFYKLDGNGAGGSLHVVLDDHNVQLPHIQWCAQNAEERGDTTGMWLARVLCMLSASQRRRM